MVMEGLEPNDRKRIDAALAAPLQGRGRRPDVARRMAAFGAVGKTEVVR